MLQYNSIDVAHSEDVPATMQVGYLAVKSGLTAVPCVAREQGQGSRKNGDHDLIVLRSLAMM